MASFTTQEKRALHPEPLVISPKSGTHTQSLIALHGRGSNGEKFGLELLRTPIPGFGTLQSVLPNAKLIFPTAAKQRAQIYKRTYVNQWFDNWSLQTPTAREELQFDGLKESAAYIHELLETEIAVVGVDNVILWGLSQGCAMSLISAILWGKERFAAVVGMCGWLPLRRRMEDSLSESDSEGMDENPFDQPEDAGPEREETAFGRVVEYLQEELQIPAEHSPATALSMPMFLGHGTEDEKVPLVLSKEAKGLLQRLDVDLEYREYDGLGHWYSGEMLRDVLLFIERSTNCKLVAKVQEAET